MSKCTPCTTAVRAGIETDTQHGAVVPALHLSSNYSFEGFGRKRAYDYSRSGNPTRDLLCNALAELEQGAGAVVTSSGMSAVALVLELVPAGGHVLAAHDCYGGHLALARCVGKEGPLHGGFRRPDGQHRAGRRPGQEAGAGVGGDAVQPAAAHHRYPPRGAGHPCRRRAAGGRQHVSFARAAAAAVARRGTWSCIRPPSTSTATATWSVVRQ